MGGLHLRNKLITSVVLLFFVTLLYQNCGPGFKVANIGSVSQSSESVGNEWFSNKGCEAGPMKTFTYDVYPFFGGSGGKCIACHVSGPGIGKFAHPNIELAYTEFASMGASKVIGQIVTNHQSSVTGEYNRAEHDRMMAAWNATQTEYAKCKNASIKVDDQPVLTISKTLPANFLTIPANNQQNGPWTTFNWNLNTEIVGQRLGTLQAQFRIEARPLVRNLQGQFQIAGYEFRNPAIQVTAANTAYDVGGVYLYLNDTANAAFTTYSDYARTFNTNQFVNLVDAAVTGPLITTTNATDKIAFNFRLFKISTGGPIVIGGGGGGGTPGGGGNMVTFTQLTAQGGVFQVSCFNCHSGGNVRGGLDLSNYAMARAQAADILARMTDNGNPMPPAGLLGATQIDQVRAWVQAGAPQ